MCYVSCHVLDNRLPRHSPAPHSTPFGPNRPSPAYSPVLLQAAWTAPYRPYRHAPPPYFPTLAATPPGPADTHHPHCIIIIAAVITSRAHRAARRGQPPRVLQQPLAHEAAHRAAPVLRQPQHRLKLVGRQPVGGGGGLSWLGWWVGWLGAVIGWLRVAVGWLGPAVAYFLRRGMVACDVGCGVWRVLCGSSSCGRLRSACPEQRACEGAGAHILGHDPGTWEDTGNTSSTCPKPPLPKQTASGVPYVQTGDGPHGTCLTTSLA